MKKYLILSLTLFLLLVFITPLHTHAQLGIPGVDDIFGGSSNSEDEAVPINNEKYNEKEIKAKTIKVKVFGKEVDLGVSKDALLTKLAKETIERIVDSTVDWINSGFDEKPAFVDDPKEFFTGIADGVAGEFIDGSDLSALCSPFQANIKISLADYYNRNFKEHKRAEAFTCTLTDVVDNIENFYVDFDTGGWDAWYAMTQNPANNPYGAYLAGQVELESRLAEQLGIEEQLLDWGSGFKSYRECIEKAPDGKCTQRGDIVTPGKVIEGQLQEHLSTDIRQLELADEFDEILGALIDQLFNKANRVFSNNGLR